MDIFAIRLNKLIKENKITKYRLAVDLNSSKQLVRRNKRAEADLYPLACAVFSGIGGLFAWVGGRKRSKNKL